jgi:predicted tellurium resistance membrane protein TerC
LNYFPNNLTFPHPKKNGNDSEGTMQDFFTKKNYLGILLGAVLLSLGFFLLGRGPADNKLALNVAPFILLLAFAVVLPISILMGKGKEEKR